MPADPRRALVLFTGGQDSTVCLAWALQRFTSVETIGFDAGEQHTAALESRLQVRAQLTKRFPRWGARLGPDHVIDVSFVRQLGETAPSQAREAQMSAGGLPNGFVPGRNLLFFTLAAGIADRRGLEVIVGGMNEVDESDYPDCRDNALKSLQVALSLGLDRPLTIETPLMRNAKADTWALAETLGGDPFVDLVVEHTYSCFLGEGEQHHPWGRGCGFCPACDLRRKGYEDWISS